MEFLLKKLSDLSLLTTSLLVFFKKVLRKKSIWLSDESISRYIELDVPRKKLHSQSYQAAYQKLFDNKKSYSKAIKEYRVNPSKFSNKPRLPKKRKFFQPIQFKKSPIRFKDGFLLLSLSKGNQPIKIKWNEKLTVPSFVIIQWNKNKKYWQLNCVMEKDIVQNELDSSKIMSIDLGLKRIATTFDNIKSITFSGKRVKSLTIGRNKLNSNTQIKLSGLKKGSRKYKKVKKANKRVNLRIDNKFRDILHKTSRTIVNEAVSSKVSKIVIGDCSGIHNGTDCGLTIDRDVLGAVNIYKVSFGKDLLKDKSKLDVIGFLTKPIGWKYKTNRDCKVASNRTLRTLTALA